MSHFKLLCYVVLIVFAVDPGNNSSSKSRGSRLFGCCLCGCNSQQETPIQEFESNPAIAGEFENGTNDNVIRKMVESNSKFSTPPYLADSINTRTMNTN